MKKNPHGSDEDQNSEPSEPPDDNKQLDNKQLDNKQLDNKQLDNKQLDNKQLNKCETIEDGTEAFMQWMGSSDKKSLKSDNPIVLIKFINDVLTVLYDTSLSKKVEVKLSSGIPYCNYCKSDDCAHVGFTICVEQLGRHRRDGKEETIEEIVNS